MKKATTLRSEREAKGLSQERLESLSGVEQSVISRLESSGPPTGVRHAIAIAKALGTTVENLFGHIHASGASTGVRRRRSERTATARASNRA